jgi:hypothetical protein
MMPNGMDPNTAMHQIYQNKVKRAHHQTQIFMAKAAVKVLRKDFGFSPEMISEFVAGLDKEIAEGRKNEGEEKTGRG